MAHLVTSQRIQATVQCRQRTWRLTNRQQLLGELSQSRKKVDMEEARDLHLEKLQDGAITLLKMNVRMLEQAGVAETLGVVTKILACNLLMTTEEEEAEAEVVVAVEVAATSVVKTATLLANAQANKMETQSQSSEVEAEVVVASVETDPRHASTVKAKVISAKTAQNPDVREAEIEVATAEATSDKGMTTAARTVALITTRLGMPRSSQTVGVSRLSHPKEVAGVTVNKSLKEMEAGVVSSRTTVDHKARADGD